MLDGRPRVLQCCTYLYLEGNATLVQLADVVQRVIAKAVEIVQLALINRVALVDIEQLTDNGCYLIHIIGIEGNNAQTYQVGNVA